MSIFLSFLTSFLIFHVGTWKSKCYKCDNNWVWYNTFFLSNNSDTFYINVRNETMIINCLCIPHHYQHTAFYTYINFPSICNIIRFYLFLFRGHEINYHSKLGFVTTGPKTMWLDDKRSKENEKHQVLFYVTWYPCPRRCICFRTARAEVSHTLCTRVVP